VKSSRFVLGNTAINVLICTASKKRGHGSDNLPFSSPMSSLHMLRGVQSLSCLILKEYRHKETEFLRAQKTKFGFLTAEYSRLLTCNALSIGKYVDDLVLLAKEEKCYRT